MTRSLTTCIALAGALLWSAPLFACEECGCEVAATPHSHQTNNAQPAEHAADHTHAVTSAEIEQDRKAILAMAGDYKVTFQFQETVGIKPGYELKEPYHSEATEFIEVIEDRGDFISLQHVLVLHDEETGEARVRTGPTRTRRSTPTGATTPGSTSPLIRTRSSAPGRRRSIRSMIPRVTSLTASGTTTVHVPPGNPRRPGVRFPAVSTPSEATTA